MSDEEEEEQEESIKSPITEKPQTLHHHLHSIDTTLTIRQITSQGLSFQLWPAATSLVTLLDSHRLSPATSPLLPILPSRRLRILELGSGTGLVAIAAAATLSAAVTATDLPHVVPNLTFNAEANAAAIEAGGGGGSVVAKGLTWGVDGDDVEYDVVLGSDVVYHDHLYEPLLWTLRKLVLGKETKFVMAHLKRWKKESAFFKKANKDFRVEVLFRDAPLEGSRVGVVVYCFSDKKKSVFAATSLSDVA